MLLLHTQYSTRYKQITYYKTTYSLTSIGLRHLRATHKANVTSPAVLSTSVTGRQMSIEVILSGGFIAVHREVTTGRVCTTHPDLSNLFHNVGHRYNCSIPVLEILHETKKPPQMFTFQTIFIILYHYVHNNVLRQIVKAVLIFCTQ